MKKAKLLERYFKGAANHRRLEVLFLLDKHDGMILEDIAGALDCNIKTISEHTRRLVQAGLVNKKYQGRAVQHSLSSPYGQRFVRFSKTF